MSKSKDSTDVGEGGGVVYLSKVVRYMALLYLFYIWWGGGGGVYSYSADTIEGPRAPPVKLAARHSSLTKVRAVGPDGRFGERQVYYFIV